MLKKDCSSMELLPHETTLKRHRSSVELLPHDVVELILERLPVKFLLRFKSVSKKWKSTIESQRFRKRQLVCRRQSRGADVLFVCLLVDDDNNGNGNDDEVPIVSGSSIICKVRFPTLGQVVTDGSCDGLLCLSSVYTPNFVINPATRWHQSFPLCGFQQLRIDRYNKEDYDIPLTRLGFGKDKLRGTYKPVWLYNSAEFGLDNVTTCEVFDFSTNAWRYVQPASPYRIISSCHKPVHLDGSLYWFTECEETKVLSFHLHTETFQVISKTPFPHIRNPRDVIMCILDNRLCVSEKIWPTQVIWSLHSSGTWEKMCSIDLIKTSSWFGEPEFALLPIAILEKNKLLLHGRGYKQYLHPLVIYDLHTKYDLLYKPTTVGHFGCYFESLFSALSN